LKLLTAKGRKMSRRVVRFSSELRKKERAVGNRSKSKGPVSDQMEALRTRQARNRREENESQKSSYNRSEGKKRKSEKRAKQGWIKVLWIFRVGGPEKDRVSNHERKKTEVISRTNLEGRQHKEGQGRGISSREQWGKA